jgi:hypothetical protein
MLLDHAPLRCALMYCFFGRLTLLHLHRRIPCVRRDPHDSLFVLGRRLLSKIIDTGTAVRVDEKDSFWMGILLVQTRELYAL